ncbi:Fibronectin type III [uncultured Caudovirales phage]|uniref:Fibronectin type III n=1 Tax=uncultured Caudovirales phage TaxID=2100421 RepID=A0A6J5Q8S9_9CAUD|nr:Fibronectin type III [uncultured Caudovirales phage]CAB4220441.1 Fibronectin type III [uncultured Caudovirales phage]
MPDKKFRGISNLPVAIPDVPDAPTVSASNVGTSRAYNNGAATVTIASPTGGLPSSYSVTTTPTTTTTTATGSTTITGLASATSYTATVTPTNVSATGSATTSSAFTATTIPNAPTIGTFTDGGTGTTGTLSFTAPATGGSAITNYSYSTDSSTYTTLSPAQTTSPLSLTGLTVGTYSFSVKAINANGTSAASSTVSGTVITPPSFESIASSSPSGVSSLTFSSIASTYVALQVRWSFINSAAGSMTMELNGNTSAIYDFHALNGNGAVATGTNKTADGANMQVQGYYPTITTYPNVGILDLFNYKSTTTNKSMRVFAGADDNSTNGSVQLRSGDFRSTIAVTQISFLLSTGTFSAGSTFALYGIKG